MKVTCFIYPYLQILLSLISSLFLSACNSKGGNDLDEELLRQLDKTIGETVKYDSLKLALIARVGRMPVRTSLEHFDWNKQLYQQYKSFICDSAMHYINANIGLAREMGRSDLLTWALIEKADLTAKAGLFTEALQLLDSVRSDMMSDELKVLYYQTYETTWQYMYEYVEGSDLDDLYMQRVFAYRDSVLQVADTDSFVYDTEYGSWLLEKGHWNEAIAFFTERLERYTMGTREYSVLASVLAYAYQMVGNRRDYGRFIAWSAISDIQGSIKENLALRSLAELCFETGHVERAYKYLMKSMDDANFFSARMRKNQSAKLLPLVAQTYFVMQSDFQRRLKSYVIIISVLTVGLMVASYYIFKQLKVVSRSLHLVSETKDRIQELNRKLSQANETLHASNAALTESSRIKEEYVGKFMELCSIHISTLEQYRKTLTRQAAAGKVEELYKLLRSENVINETLKDFYTTFDTAFLNIFPRFVEQFNALFPSQDRVVLKRDERLNTELRTFALIRLGITSSDKIAQFLRCSITTIYTYRSKRKKRSLCPDNFDEEILKIGY